LLFNLISDALAQFFDEEWERIRRNRGCVQNSVCTDKLSFYGERTSSCASLSLLRHGF
jgi:hypothetical protein